MLTFSPFRMGAYSRWALIRGWVLIQINTVGHVNAVVFLTVDDHILLSKLPLYGLIGVSHK